MLREAIDLAEGALATADPVASADLFCAALRPWGITYFQARHYRRPTQRLTSQRHWDAGGFLHRLDERAWVGRPSSNYVCFDCNPLLEPVAKGVTRFRFSDFAPHRDRRFGQYWEAMSEGGIGDAIGAMAFGAGRETAALHIGFAESALEYDRHRTVAVAAALVVEHLLGATLPAEDIARPELTRRERDVMRFLAEGKTDWEISIILSIGEATARFHADNARRKLGASNRAHAVARYIAEFGFT